MDNKVYLLVLEGQGDINIKIVDTMTYNWITNNDLGRAPDTDKYSWDDKTCPVEIKRKIWEEQSGHYNKCSFEEFKINISSGSYNNDRALMAPVITINDEEGFFWEITKAMKFINKHNLEVLGEYQGYIY